MIPDVMFVAIPGFVILIGGVIIFRWLVLLQRHVDEHAERIAWLEAKANGRPRGGQ